MISVLPKPGSGIQPERFRATTADLHLPRACEVEFRRCAALFRPGRPAVHDHRGLHRQAAEVELFAVSMKPTEAFEGPEISEAGSQKLVEHLHYLFEPEANGTLLAPVRLDFHSESIEGMCILKSAVARAGGEDRVR